ncbi:Stk1 family PASTA domain-containing Ser/Thr kinase [Orenia marismortui]|uniref:non-specific serine/threonine protein kinase n=1 Tax=Orenia marismortui TaxID=46469 RepID=A0A4R8GT71_9FIRM|nr:Stk1 family PASTA domain-containing Ser/Thr kinase [Orenia marismortui]TDX49202.1 serine/threonine-protein kinase [Orenia marismortui]
MIGKVLNNRYEIIEKVGTGGMAIVYRATDKLLGRPVAVKILQPQFADNETAVKRFNREAQSVASLSHPNIVNIFDIGRDDDLHYIVMEYVTGNDLKEELKKVGRFEVDKAIQLITGICNALIKAHRNNIIHCDIKPHNILVTKDNRAKVTDFGIARAVTSATMAHTNSVMGSAHYLSPEQAKGAKVSTKSDIYSLGIVLYELLTGQVPFTGENHISIALKHLEEKPPSPQEINQNISDELASIILKAIAKKPEDRYNSVVEMLRDLKEIEINTTQKVKNKDITNQHTMVMSKEDYQKEINKEINKKVSKEVNKKTTKKESLLKSDFKENNRGVRKLNKRNHKATSFEKTPKKNTKKKKKKRNEFLTALLILGIIGIAIMGVGYYMLINYMEVEEVRVPDVVGKHVENARQELADKGLELKVYYRSHSSEVEKDHIISQSIKADKKIKVNRVIEVVVSKGAKLSKVPNLLGIELREAEIKLDKLDLEIGEVKEEYNNEVKKGQIISQDPRPDIEVKSGATVDLLISKGKEPKEVLIPNLVGLKKEEAVEKLRERNLLLGQVLERESLNYLKGRVIAQNPSPGKMTMEGTTIQLIISKGIRNPRGSEVKSPLVRIDVPAGNEKRVQIVVSDDNGQRTVYDQVHQPHDKVEKEVITVGSAVIRVYFDGQLNYEKRL